MRVASALCVALVLASCGGGGKSANDGNKQAREPTKAERAYPVLLHVPADPTYAVVAKRTGDIAKTLRELVAAATMLFGENVSDIDAALRREFGFSWIVEQDLAGIGFALDRGAAVFGTKGLPTLVLPVADSARLAAYLDRRRPTSDFGSVRHKGVEVYSWAPNDDPSVSWAIHDGWFYLHVGLPGEKGFPWLDSILAVADVGGLGGSDKFGAAIEQGARTLGEIAGGEMPGYVGLVNLAQLVTSMRDWGDDSIVGCLGALSAISGEVYIGGRIGTDGADGSIGIGLSAEAASALRDHIASAPPAGYRKVRAGSGVYADLSLDLVWLESVRKRSMCSLLSDFGRIRDPSDAWLGRRGASSYHLAVQDLNAKELSGRVAAYFDLTDRSVVDKQLDRIPMRSLVESKKTIAGKKVRELGIPGKPKLTYRLTNKDLTVTLGKGLMKTVLSGGDDEGEGPLEVAAVGIFPKRLSKLSDLLTLALDALGFHRARAAGEQVARRLRRYESGEIALELDGNVLRLRASMRLTGQ